MIVLTPEEHSSYLFSLSNLACLKLFHDAGIDVSSFSDYMVDVNYNDYAGNEIFINGCSQLFTSMKCIESYDEESETFLEKLKEQENLEWLPDILYLFQDNKLDTLYHYPSLKKEIQQFIKDTNKPLKKVYCDAEIIPLSNGFGIVSYYIYEFHDLTKMVISIRKQIDKLYKKVERSKR